MKPKAADVDSKASKRIPQDLRAEVSSIVALLVSLIVTFTNSYSNAENSASSLIPTAASGRICQTAFEQTPNVNSRLAIEAQPTSHSRAIVAQPATQSLVIAPSAVEPQQAQPSLGARVLTASQKVKKVTREFLGETYRTRTLNWWTKPTDIHPKDRPGFVVAAEGYFHADDLWLTRVLKRYYQAVLTRVYRTFSLNKPFKERLHSLQYGDPNIAISIESGLVRTLDRLIWPISDALKKRNRIDQNYVSRLPLQLVTLAVTSLIITIPVIKYSEAQRQKMFDEAIVYIATEFEPFLAELIESDHRFEDLNELYKEAKAAADTEMQRSLLAEAHFRYSAFMKFVKLRPHTDLIQTTDELVALLRGHSPLKDLTSVIEESLSALDPETTTKPANRPLKPEEINQWQRAITQVWIFHTRLEVFRQELTPNLRQSTKDAEDTAVVRSQMQTDPIAQKILKAAQSNRIFPKTAFNIYSKIAEAQMMAELAQSIGLFDTIDESVVQELTAGLFSQHQIH